MRSFRSAGSMRSFLGARAARWLRGRESSGPGDQVKRGAGAASGEAGRRAGGGVGVALAGGDDAAGHDELEGVLDAHVEVDDVVGGDEDEVAGGGVGGGGDEDVDDAGGGLVLDLALADAGHEADGPDAAAGVFDEDDAAELLVRLGEDGLDEALHGAVDAAEDGDAEEDGVDALLQALDDDVGDDEAGEDDEAEGEQGAEAGEVEGEEVLGAERRRQQEDGGLEQVDEPGDDPDGDDERQDDEQAGDEPAPHRAAQPEVEGFLFHGRGPGRMLGRHRGKSNPGAAGRGGRVPAGAGSQSAKIWRKFGRSAGQESGRKALGRWRSTTMENEAKYRARGPARREDPGRGTGAVVPLRRREKRLRTSPNPSRWQFKPTVRAPQQFYLPFNTSVPDGDFTFIDLFAGIGGLRMAFESVGGDCVFTSEWDDYAQTTYNANFIHGHSIAGDITKVRPADIPDHDILLAGFPCQPFSIAGVSKKNALGRAHGFLDETQGTLFFDVARILAEKRPRAFMLENVKNLESHDKGHTFAVIRDVLTRELGYHIHFRVIDAQHFVPQHRERIVIVGFAEDVPFSWDALKLPPKGRRHASQILHPEDGSERPYDHDGDRFVDPVTGKVRDKYILTDKLWAYLQAYAAKHRAAGNGFGFGMIGPNDVARTLSARYYKDGSEILVSRGPGRNPRRLTPRECARLMGFPDQYRIPVSDTRAYKQFGNSVVVPVFREVARLMRPFLVDDVGEVPVREGRRGAVRRAGVG